MTIGQKPLLEFEDRAALDAIVLPRAGYQTVKRLLDLAIVIPLTVLFLPLFAIIAVLIKLDSPGPVLFSQVRAGKDGRPFQFLKFRSMVHNSPEDLHREYVQRLIRENLAPDAAGEGRRSSLKLQNDPRITRVGRVLRHYSLDELPQLFNVLKGEMSLVGPRPSLPYEVEVYRAWHRTRLKMLPGCTGLWQVTARNRVSFDEMVALDLEYMEKMSPWLDLKLILLTPWAMLHGRGAG